MEYEYSFFLSHAGSEGRQIALELERQLAFLGLGSYIANLENIKFRDDYFLLEKMKACRSFVMIFTEEYCRRLNENILSPENFVCYEVNNAFGFKLDTSNESDHYGSLSLEGNESQEITGTDRPTNIDAQDYSQDENRHIFIIGFGGWTKHSLIRNFKESNLVKGAFDNSPDGKNVSNEKKEFYQNMSAIVTFDTAREDAPYSESIHQLLSQLRYKEKLKKYFLNQENTREDHEKGNMEALPAVVFTGSLPDIRDEIEVGVKAYHEVSDGIFEHDKGFEKFAEGNLDKIKEKLMPHKFGYANDYGASEYIKLFSDEAEQGQDVIDKFLEVFKKHTACYVADNRLLGQQQGIIKDNDFEFDGNDLFLVRSMMFDAVNMAQRGTLNIVSLGVGTGKRDSKFVKAIFDLISSAEKKTDGTEFNRFKNNMLGSVHYYLTDISMRLIAESVKNIKSIFGENGDSITNELLRSVNLTPVFCSFKHIDKLKAELRRKPDTQNLFLLIGNTYNAITNSEKIDFSERMSEITEPGDVLILEIDMKITEGAVKQAERNGSLGSPGVAKFFTSSLLLSDEVCEIVKDECGTPYTKRFLTKCGHELIYTKYIDKNKSVRHFPLTCVPVGGYAEKDYNYTVDEITDIFKEHINVLMSTGDWHIDGVVRLYNKGSSVALVLGIMKRSPVGVN